jgi:hypothetical protein
MQVAGLGQVVRFGKERFPVHPHYTKPTRGRSVFKIPRTHDFAVSLLLQTNQKAASLSVLPRAHVRFNLDFLSVDEWMRVGPLIGA